MSQQRLPLPDALAAAREAVGHLREEDVATLVAELLDERFSKEAVQPWATFHVGEVKNVENLRMLRTIVQTLFVGGRQSDHRLNTWREDFAWKIANNPAADDELVMWAIDQHLPELVRISDKDHNKVMRPDDCRDDWFTDERTQRIIETYDPLGPLMDWMGHYMPTLTTPMIEAYINRFYEASLNDKPFVAATATKDSRREQIIHQVLRRKELAGQYIISLWMVCPRFRPLLLDHPRLPFEAPMKSMEGFVENMPEKAKPGEQTTFARSLFEALLGWEKLPTQFMYFFMEDASLHRLLAGNDALPADIATHLMGLGEPLVIDQLLRKDTLPEEIWRKAWDTAFSVEPIVVAQYAPANQHASKEQLLKSWDMLPALNQNIAFDIMRHKSCDSKLYWRIAGFARKQKWWGYLLALLLCDDSLSEATIAKLVRPKKDDEDWIHKFPSSALRELAKHPNAPVWALDLIVEFAGPSDSRAAEDNLDNRKEKKSA